MTCKNCGENFGGNFCSKCGQKAKVDRINAKYVLAEIPETFFQINHGLLFSIKELFLRPGKTIREYLEGKRKNYIKPIAYVLLLSTLYALLAKLITGSTFLGEIALGMAEGGTSSESDPVLSSTLNWVANNHAYSMVLFLPFFSFASFLAFKKYNFNFFEHFVLNAYLCGQQAIIFSFFLIVQHTGNIEFYYFPTIPLCISIGYAFWTFIQFFNSTSKISSFGRSLITYFIYFIIIVVSFVIVFIINIV